MAPSYIIVWHPPASRERRNCTEFNPSMVKVISWYLRRDAPVSWLRAGSKVNMLQLVGVLPLGRDAVSVFYSPSQLGHRTLVGECLTPLQRCSRCILQPQLTGQSCRLTNVQRQLLPISIVYDLLLFIITHNIE